MAKYALGVMVFFRKVNLRMLDFMVFFSENLTVHCKL